MSRLMPTTQRPVFNHVTEADSLTEALEAFDGHIKYSMLFLIAHRRLRLYLKSYLPVLAVCTKLFRINKLQHVSDQSLQKI